MRLPTFRTIALSALVAGMAIAAPAFAKNPNVGGAPMYATKN
ncbi:MAG: fasciclin domain-containing protein, partial [Mesorhizobium sp.]